MTLLYRDGLAPPPRLQDQHREYQRRPWWRRTTRWSWSTCSQTCPPPSPSRRGSCRCPGPRLNTRGREPARASYSVRGSEIPELETCSDRIYLYFYRDPVIEIIEDKLSSFYVQYDYITASWIFYAKIFIIVENLSGKLCISDINIFFFIMIIMIYTS